MAKTQTDLVHGTISKTLILFALPTLGASILNSLNGTIAAAWVGRLLGPQALSATMNGNLIMLLLYSGAFGLGMAVSIIIAQAYGAGDTKLMRRAFGNGIAIFLFLSIVLTILGWVEAETILKLLATPAEIFQDALTYYKILVIALPSYLISILFVMALRGTGDSLTPLISLVVAIIAEIILCPILINGWGPIPKMGIAGAAYAILIGDLITLVVLLLLVYKRNLPLRLRGKEFGYIRLSSDLTKKVLNKGLPISLQMMIVSIAALTMIGLINSQGITVSSAYAMVQQTWPYLQLPAMAVSASVSAMVAQNIGAGLWPRVNQITLWGIIYAVAMTVFSITLLLIFDRSIFTLFVSSTSPEIPVAMHIENLTVVSFVFFGITSVLMSTVRANGSVWIPLIILTISQLPVRLGIAYLMRDTWGQDALWLSFPAANIVSMLLMAAHYAQGSWRKDKTILEEEEPLNHHSSRNYTHPIKLS